MIFETTEIVEVVVLETTEDGAAVEDVGEVLEVIFEPTEAFEEVEEEATLATLAPATAALPAVDEEDNLPTPALVLSLDTLSAGVAFHTESAEPIASTALVSVNEPKSPEPDSELTWQSRPSAAEHELVSPAEGTLKRPLVSLSVAAESGALQSWKTLPSMRILAPASTSKL